MKRITALMLSLIMAFAVITVIPSTAAASGAENGRLGLLAELEIMSGDPDGNLRLDDYVSRAEFTKIAVAASAYKNSVATNLSISPFPDVTYRHWAAPYVRVGVTNGIVSGYPDGTFRPEDTVLYEEAVTILLRVLGYTNTDFGVAWPSGQIGLADNLDMSDDVICSAGELMTRRQVARLVYNTLKTKQKGSQNTLLDVFDSTIYTDTTLVASSNEDSAIALDEVFTTSGIFKITDGFDLSNIGLKGDAIVKHNKKLIAFIPDESERATQEYIVYSVLGGKVMAYQGGSVKQIDINDDTAAYKGVTKTTFAQLKSQLDLGDRLMVRMSDTGEADYVTYGKGNVVGPVTAVSGTWKTTLNLPDNVTVTRNGISVNEEDIQNYDVVYYLKDLNMVMAYASKITGVYEKATPNRDMPESITVSGNEYELEGSVAFNKLYSGGTFEYGDTVTLLLGKDNKVADVISPAATANGVVGYLTATGTKDYLSGDLDTYTNYYINIVTPDGTSYEYITDRDYAESVNSVVELSFSNGYARISRVNTSPKISGTFDWASKRIGTTKISSSIEILDIGTRDVSETSIYTKIYGQRLDGVEIDEESILYAKKNEAGQIEKMILDNVTNDAFSYGFVIKTEKNGLGRSYDYLADGRRYTTNKILSISAGDAVMIAGDVRNPDYLKSIETVSGKVSNVTSDRLIANDTTYKISDKVEVYKRESYVNQEYSMSNIAEVVSNVSRYRITAYYDKQASAGGRIRVIIISDK